jgi:hypothetical protein
MTVPPTATAALCVGTLVLALAAQSNPGTPAGAGARPRAEPFASWPKGVTPDAVIVITGQTYGYLQPCGCSRPQLGGLERRSNFVASLRAKGWPTTGVDLGDVLPMSGVVPEQPVLKYAITMRALREMGYAAVGLGSAEFANGVFLLLEQYAAKKDQPPYMLAGNVGGLVGGKVTRREDAFPGPDSRPLVKLTAVAEVGAVAVGVAGVVGPSVARTAGPQTLVGVGSEREAVAAAVKELRAHPKAPTLNVLLYQGSFDEASAQARREAAFPVVVCLSDDPEPPEVPDAANAPGGGQVLVVRVGHKGRYVGVLGAFRRANGTFDLKYELVPMSEAYVTPGSDEAAREANPALGLLEEYSARVKAADFLGKFPQRPPPFKARHPTADLSYVGSEACAGCHAPQFAKWKESGHSHAFEALERLAKRPAGRQFDGECVVCHTVGLGYKTGYRDDLLTPHLKDVGCESCHGPGAGHAADPKDAVLLALQSPWRAAAADRLPTPARMAAVGRLAGAERAKFLTPQELRAVRAVGTVCVGCHDTENDPNFDLLAAWPKVAHPGPK